MQEDEFPSSININDHSEFDIALSSGWVKRAFVKRIAETDDVKKTDMIEIKMK